MEEIHLLNADQMLSVLNAIQKHCGLILPGGRVLDPVTVHLYQKKHHRSAKDNRLFLIRWGVHQIFQYKSFPQLPAAESCEQIKNIIGDKAAAIRKSLVEYCPEILKDALTLRLDPELSRRTVLLTGYQIKVCPTPKKAHTDGNGGWPNFCLFLSWTDEDDTFQEFRHPLAFDEESRCFNIREKDIVDNFIRYRDTVI